MTAMLSILYLLATGVAAEAGRFSIDYASGGKNARAPILGSNPDNSLWLYLAETGRGKTGEFQTITKVKSSKALKIASPSPSMDDLYWSGLFIEKDNTVTEFDLYNHGRQSKLGGNLSDVPNSIFLSYQFPQLIGLGTNGHAWLWDRKVWNDKKEWIDLGGKFSKSPVGILNPFEKYTIQLDLFGISTENKLLHQILTVDKDDNWEPKFKDWEIFDNGDYSDQVRLTVPPSQYGEELAAFRIYTLDGQRGLKYKTASAKGFSDWQYLGGSWTQVPAVVELTGNRIEICGRGITSNAYWYKYWNGTGWTPPGQKWRYVGDSFASEPALVAKGEEARSSYMNMMVAGVADNSSLVNQAYIGGLYYEGSGIVPNAWYSDIDDVTKPSKSSRYRDEEL